MVHINLLPWRDKQKKLIQVRFGITVGAFAFVGVLVVLMINLYYTGLINSQVSRNKALEAALVNENSIFRDLKKKNLELDEMKELIRFLFSLKESSYKAVRVLNELAAVNLDTITLTKIDRKGDTIMVSGSARSNLQITLFMDSIEKSDHFIQPVLTEISGKDSEIGQRRTFKLRINLEK